MSIKTVHQFKHKLYLPIIRQIQIYQNKNKNKNAGIFFQSTDSKVTTNPISIPSPSKLESLADKFISEGELDGYCKVIHMRLIQDEILNSGKNVQLIKNKSKCDRLRYHLKSTDTEANFENLFKSGTFFKLKGGLNLQDLQFLVPPLVDHLVSAIEHGKTWGCLIKLLKWMNGQEIKNIRQGKKVKRDPLVLNLLLSALHHLQLNQIDSHLQTIHTKMAIYLLPHSPHNSETIDLIVKIITHCDLTRDKVDSIVEMLRLKMST